jgi:AcrR family transcriptional regulator
MGEALRHAGGLRDVDTQMLVDLSGVSRRAFYELFGDKIDCFIWAHTLAVNRIGVHKRDEQEMAA